MVGAGRVLSQRRSAPAKGWRVRVRSVPSGGKRRRVVEATPFSEWQARHCAASRIGAIFNGWGGGWATKGRATKKRSLRRGSTLGIHIKSVS